MHGIFFSLKAVEIAIDAIEKASLGANDFCYTRCLFLSFFSSVLRTD